MSCVDRAPNTCSIDAPGVRLWSRQWPWEAVGGPKCAHGRRLLNSRTRPVDSFAMVAAAECVGVGAVLLGVIALKFRRSLTTAFLTSGSRRGVAKNEELRFRRNLVYGGAALVIAGALLFVVTVTVLSSSGR